MAGNGFFSSLTAVSATGATAPPEAERIPVLLLTGFLGSGKTTLLNHILAQPAMADTLVIVNEFGAVPLDHLMVVHHTGEMVVELGNGCLCCSIRGDLVTTLREALWRFARGGQRQFQRVVIETSGLATPAPIVHTLLTSFSLAAHYRVDSVVAMVDLATAAATLDRHPEAARQIALADVLLLSKGDLAPASAALRARLDAINPAAQRHAVAHGQIDAALLWRGWAPHETGADRPDALPRWLREDAYGRYVSLHADEQPLTPEALNQHGDHIHAFCFTADEPIARDAFNDWMEFLLGLMGEHILRVKGILNIEDEPLPLVIHGVQHIFHPPQRLPTWPDADRRSRIVFITHDVERVVIEKTFAAFMAAFTPAEEAHA